MKKSIFAFLSILCLAGTAEAQSFAVSPDSCLGGSQTQFTIRGSGTHFSSESYLAVILLDGSTPIGEDNAANVVNDSLITTSLVAPDTAGWLAVEIIDLADTTNRIANSRAIYDRGSPTPEIVSVSPTSGYRGQKLFIDILTAGIDIRQSLPQSILFVLDSTHSFTGHWSVAGYSDLWSEITIPDSMPEGTYDVVLIQDTSETQSSITVAKAFQVLSDSFFSFQSPGPTEDTFSVVMLARGLGFTSQSNVSLVCDTDSALHYTAASVFAEGDSMLTARFIFSVAARTDPYDVVIGGFSRGLIVMDTFNNAVAFEELSGVTSANQNINLGCPEVMPNPVDDRTTIFFSLRKPSHVRLRLLDALGRTVATLCDRSLNAGPQRFEWLTQDLPAGSYFYELTTGEEIYGGRVIVRH